MRTTGILALGLCTEMAFFSISPAGAFSGSRVLAAGPNGEILLSAKSNSELSLLKEGTTRRLAHSPGCGTYAALSPEGNRIGFKLIFPSGQQAPATVETASGAVSLLHEPCERSGQVSFAADGTVAFTIGETLFVRRTDLRKILLGVYSNLAPISPDGMRVVFNDDGDQLWLMDCVSGSRRRISDGRAGYAEPQWSPDGQSILFSSLDGALQVYNLPAGQAYHLGEGFSPCWLPDSRTVLYCRKKEAQGILVASDIFCSSFDGVSTAQLTSTPAILESGLCVSRDGARVLYRDEAGPALRASPLQRNGLPGGSSAIPALGEPAVISGSETGDAEESSARGVREDDPLLRTHAYAAVQQLDMPYVHQAWDTPDWFNGNSACAPTTAVMTLAYYGVLPPWELLCTWHKPDHTSLWGRYVCEQYTFREVDYVSTARDPNGRTSWGGYGFMWTGSLSPRLSMHTYYQYHGLSSEHVDGPAHSSIANEISAGYPISLCVGLTSAGHLVAAHGIGTEPHTLIVNDPWGNKNLGTYPNYSGKNVPYDWPGYNNGNQNLVQVYWSASSRMAPPAASDTLVDDLQFSSGFMLNNSAPASMALWKDRVTGHAGHAWYVTTTASETTDACYAVWTPSLPQPGEYEVLAYVPSFSTATKALYLVQNGTAERKVTVNQMAGAGGWLSLGVHTFMPGGSVHVRLGDGTGRAGEILAFDAVRWSYRGTAALADATHPVVADRFRILGNYPNPFNPSTRIRFVLPTASAVRLRIVNMLGEYLNEYEAGRYETGEHEIVWNAGSLPSGVYFATLEAVPEGNGRARRETVRLVLSR